MSMTNDIPFPTQLFAPYQSPSSVADQYAQVGNLQANAGLTRAQTVGATQQNQLTALYMQNFQRAAAMGQGQPDPTTPSSIVAAAPTFSAGGVAQDPTQAPQTGTQSAPMITGTGNPQIGSLGNGAGADDISGAMFQQYAPTPTAMPPQMAAKVAAFNMGGPMGQAQAKSLTDQWNSNVANVNQNKAKAATQAYLNANSVVTSDPGTAFATLNRINPDAAAKIKAQYPDDSDAQLDTDVRAFAQHIGAATHQYSDRPTTMSNGVLIDTLTGTPVIGTAQVLTGLDASDKQKAFDAANKMVSVRQSDGSYKDIPTWQFVGAHSAESYVIGADHAARSIAANTPAGAAPTHNAILNGPAPAAAPVPATAAPAAPGTNPLTAAALPAAAPPGFVQPTRPGQTQSGPTAPTTAASGSVNWSDPPASLKAPTPVSGAPTGPVISGTGQTPAQAAAAVGAVNAATARAGALKTQIDAAATNSDQRMERNNDTISNLPYAITGTGAPLRLAADQAAVTAGLASDATKQKVAATLAVNKNLTNTALERGKLLFPSRYTASEVDIMMNKANASGNQTPDSIHELVLEDNLMAGYDKQKQQDYNAFIGAGGNPDKFSSAYQNSNSLQQYAASNRQAAGAALTKMDGIPTLSWDAKQSSGNARDSRGFIPNKSYTDKNGTSSTYLGNGKWQ